METFLPQAHARCDSPDRDTLALAGELTFTSAAQVFERAARILDAGAQTHLDLAGLTRTDSAGLGCVLALRARASRTGRQLIVANMPEGLRALAEVCDARELLESGSA